MPRPAHFQMKNFFYCTKKTRNLEHSFHSASPADAGVLRNPSTFWNLCQLGVAVKWPKHVRACVFGGKIVWGASVFGNFQFLSFFTFSEISFSKISFSDSSIVPAIRWNYFCSFSDSLKLTNRWSHFDSDPWKRSQTARRSQQTAHFGPRGAAGAHKQEKKSYTSKIRYIVTHKNACCHSRWDSMERPRDGLLQKESWKEEQEEE
jgi:hypothetical protein